MDCSLSGSSGCGIILARILESVAISSSRGSSQPRDRTWVSCIGRGILYHWTTWEAPMGCGMLVQDMKQEIGYYFPYLVGEETVSEKACNVLGSLSQNVALLNLSVCLDKSSFPSDELLKRRRHHCLFQVPSAMKSHYGCSISVCWMNEWMNAWTTQNGWQTPSHSPWGWVSLASWSCLQHFCPEWSVF